MAQQNRKFYRKGVFRKNKKKTKHKKRDVLKRLFNQIIYVWIKNVISKLRYKKL